MIESKTCSVLYQPGMPRVFVLYNGAPPPGVAAPKNGSATPFAGSNPDREGPPEATRNEREAGP